MAEASVIRIKPFFYIHVLDNNTNVTRVESGPQTFTRQDHEKVVAGPDPMIMIPPRHYCIISNPAVRSKTGEPEKTPSGQVILRQGDEEIRYDKDPFPLYPGQKLFGKVTPLQIVPANSALRLKATRDCEEPLHGKRVAGEEWLFPGPNTYYPSIAIQIVELVKARIVQPHQALKIRAKTKFTDKSGKVRETGEEWLIKNPGAYLLEVEEEFVETLNAYVLTDTKAIHMRANRTFTDEKGKLRKAGEEWLITNKDTEYHICDVNETVLGEVKLITLTNRQYCVVLDPWSNGKQNLGQKDLRKGELSFFLEPGERLEAGIQNVHVLSEHEALLLRARENFVEIDENKKEVQRLAGDRWMVKGPTDFIPPITVEIVEKRHKIALDENEGIYVRDIKTGKVTMVKNDAYMLQPNEELWKKELPKEVERLLADQRSEDISTERDKTRVVTYRAPHNHAVQIYDYKAKESRVVFGPDLIMLGPDEHFTVISLSGDVPKQPKKIHALSLLLGPDFMTDLVTVETSDHARLSLKLSYNWRFKVDKNNKDDAAKVFNVPDFVGDSCKAIASRVRGAVAGASFDKFHRNSAEIIREAVFGKDENGEIKNVFAFSANNLEITNVDIQSVEPVDQRTRDSLQKSVQLAIEITTKSQEAAARHESTRLEQEAMGRLERQKISDEAEAEKSRKNLIQLQAESAAVESTGQATAEAKARAEASNIEGKAAVEQAKLSAQAKKIAADAELEQLNKSQAAEISHIKALNELEINKAQKLGAIQSAKFKKIVASLGSDTIQAMAEAGPATQAKLLNSLGLKSFLITDGNNPINLFNTAAGLVGEHNPQ